MRHLLIIFFSVLVFASCNKEKRLKYTSKYKDEFKTEVIIDYWPASNETSIKVVFSIPTDEYVATALRLPKDSYLKLNGVETFLQDHYSYYERIVDGKPVCTIEFKDYDETVYLNSIAPPDTAYFVNLPDTVSHLVDFQFQVNAPVVSSDEVNLLCLDACDDQGTTLHYGTDSVITVKHYYLVSGSNQVVYLRRDKVLPNPNLPLGGGSITYRYNIEKTIYVE